MKDLGQCEHLKGFSPAVETIQILGNVQKYVVGEELDLFKAQGTRSN